MQVHIKKTLQPFIDGDNILFGNGNAGLTRKIANTTENVNLIKYLAGEMDRKSLHLTDDELNTKIEKFKELGLLSSNDYDPELRYANNYSYFEWVDKSSNIDPQSYQRKLADSYVVIFGIDKIGTTVAEQLVRAGVGRLKLVDSAVVKEANLANQSIYTEKDIGKKKVNVCKQYLLAINSKVQIKAVDCEINSSNEVEKYLDSDVDLIIDSMDKTNDNEWFDRISNKVNKPVIFGSYASTSSNVFVKIPGVTVDYMDFLGKEQIADDHLIDYHFPAAIIAPVTYMAAGLVGYNAIMLLTGLRVPTEAVQIDFDGWTIEKYDVRKK